MHYRPIALFISLLLAASGQEVAVDCSRCDCSHFPIDTPECVKCCFATKIIVTSASDTSVTGKRILGREEKFQVWKATKINGRLEPGAAATVYYHGVSSKQIATRIDVLQVLHGALMPGSSPNPPDTCESIIERNRALGRQLPPIPENAMRIFLGNSEAYSGQDRLVVLKIGDEEALILQRASSGIFVSFKVWAADGKLLAQAVDNELFINLNDAYRIERTSSSDLSLYQTNGELVLNIQFVNPRVIKILGRFFGPTGESVNVTENEQTFTSRTNARFITHGSCFGGGSGLIEMTAGGQILVR